MSDTTTRWGKAGVRRDPGEARAIARQRGRERLEAEQATERAHRAWKDGRAVPWRITTALDIRGLHGPEVDEALGVPEPTVDEWEAGTLYPTWGQILALAALTGFPAPFFTEPVKSAAIRAQDTSLRFHMEVGDEPPPVLSFTQDAIKARLGHPGRLDRTAPKVVRAMEHEIQALRRRMESAASGLDRLDQIAATLDTEGQQLTARTLTQALAALRQALEGAPR